MAEVRHPQEEGTSLRILLRYVWAHLGLVLSIWIAVVVVTLFATLATRPEYESKVRLLLQSTEPSVIDVKKVVSQRYETDTYLKTQMQLIRSEQLARRVISALNLKGHKEFRPADESVVWDWYHDGYLKLRGVVQARLRSLFSFVSGSSNPSVDSSHLVAEDGRDPLVRGFLSRLKVKSTRGTRLVDISIRGYFPGATAEIANVVADEFIKWNLELEFFSTRRATKWLEGQLVELKKAVEQSERALQAYRESENLTGVEMAESPEVITGALGTLSREIMEARSERIAAEAAYREFTNYFGKNGTSTKLENIPVGLLGGATLVTNLQVNLTEAQREYADLSRRYKPKHPTIVQLRSRIDYLKSSLQREISLAVKKLETRFLVAQKRERSLMTNLEEEKARVIRLGGKTVKLGVLKREVDSNRKLYELFLGRIKETNLATNLRVTNIQIVDRASVPKSPVRPAKGRNLIMAVVLGLFLGVGTAFAVEYFDTSFKDPEEAERILGVPAMATVDHLGNLRKKKRELVILERRTAGYSKDSFNTLRTNLLYSAPVEQRQVLLVTSSTPVEGKTFIASNLALSLANLGEEVLLIDADLRKPRLHRLFGLKLEPGLTDLLVGRNELGDVLHDTDRGPLFVIPAGHHSPNPADLLSSDRVEKMLLEMRNRFQYIVVDSPPVLSVADPLTLVPKVDGVLFVVWAGRTPGRHVVQGINILKEVRGGKTFFGVVMNRVTRRRGSGYYYYHHYYGDYYAKGSDTG
ncbi:MAG: GumC family protein [Nitrospinota bacterium]